MAIAWLLSQGYDIVPILGIKQRQYLAENAAVVAIALTPAEMEQIDAVAPHGVAMGDRYADMSSVNR